MELKQMASLLRLTADEGAEKALLALGQLPDAISKSQAYRTYGRSNVDRWLTEGLLKLSNQKLSRANLEAIAAASNRVTYLPVAERKG
ncbi:hypothetical protein [Mucilaginibacter sp. FT3.2]|uniref:hypothetical protein n=1 Tax=Mucilaginibacter sp. FT3.2 TaxID=2723090 RepID=UPI00160A2712|nr:hypothetical protein [Mucilaginibacter sp. FT3.2]MBB6234259.1 hypothetical protein [Mucilaginibacter sp. FT3.2]